MQSVHHGNVCTQQGPICLHNFPIPAARVSSVNELSFPWRGSRHTFNLSLFLKQKLHFHSRRNRNRDIPQKRRKRRRYLKISNFQLFYKSKDSLFFYRKLFFKSNVINFVAINQKIIRTKEKEKKMAKERNIRNFRFYIQCNSIEDRLAARTPQSWYSATSFA